MPIVKFKKDGSVSADFISEYQIATSADFESVYSLIGLIGYAEFESSYEMLLIEEFTSIYFYPGIATNFESSYDIAYSINQDFESLYTFNHSVNQDFESLYTLNHSVNQDFESFYSVLADISGIEDFESSYAISDTNPIENNWDSFYVYLKNVNRVHDTIWMRKP